MRTLDLKIPPVVVALLAGTLMWLAAVSTPALGFNLPKRRTLAAGFATAGGVIVALGVISFRCARTTVNPTKPASASTLVVSGIYRWTRNPMYLGVLGVLIGWAFLLAHALAFVLLPAFVLYLNRFQIEPEETALAASFGRDFAAYRSRVRRWL